MGVGACKIHPPPKKKAVMISASESPIFSVDPDVTTGWRLFLSTWLNSGFWPIHQIVYVHLWGAVLVLRGFTNWSNFLGRKGAVLFFFGGGECENRQIWGGLRKMRSNQKQRYMLRVLMVFCTKNCIFCCVCVCDFCWCSDDKKNQDKVGVSPGDSWVRFSWL